MQAICGRKKNTYVKCFFLCVFSHITVMFVFKYQKLDSGLHKQYITAAATFSCEVFLPVVKLGPSHTDLEASQWQWQPLVAGVNIGIPRSVGEWSHAVTKWNKSQRIVQERLAWLPIDCVEDTNLFANTCKLLVEAVVKLWTVRHKLPETTHQLTEEHTFFLSNQRLTTCL